MYKPAMYMYNVAITYLYMYNMNIVFNSYKLVVEICCVFVIICTCRYMYTFVSITCSGILILPLLVIDMVSW